MMILLLLLKQNANNSVGSETDVCSKMALKIFKSIVILTNIAIDARKKHHKSRLFKCNQGTVLRLTKSCQSQNRPLIVFGQGFDIII